MTEVRRVTTTPVDWGSLDAGMVLAVATGRSHRCSVSECRILLFSSSGAVLTETKLAAEVRHVVDAAVNSAGVVAVVTNNTYNSSSNSGMATLAFLCGPQLLSSRELPSGVTGHHAVTCLRLGSRDVAVCASGTRTLLGCTHFGVECDVWTLWDFGDAYVTRVVRGKQQNDALALLDNGSVALVALRVSDDDSLRCVLQHYLQVSEEAKPIQAVFAAGSMLWVLCDDYSLCGYWFPPSMDDVETFPVRLFSEQLSLPIDTEDTVKVFMAGESRTCGLHIAIQTPTAVYFCAFALHSTDGFYEAPTPSGWSNSVLIWSGHIHDFSIKQCAYELLVQSELGVSPLSVMSLRQNASVLKFEESQNRLLSHQVVCAAPEKLTGLREQCELKVQELEIMTSKVMDLKTVEQALSELLILQDCLVATLHRERELNKDLQSYQSVSMHLIKRLHVTYVRLSVYQLFCAAEIGDKLDMPLCSLLNIEETRHSAVTYREELRAQFEQEFELMPVSSLETLTFWGSQDTPPAMCIDAILSHMGCTDQISLRTIVQQMTVIQPGTALLVLYCTIMATKYSNASFQIENAFIVQFLNNFCLPSSLGVWARLSFMADRHIIDPAEVGTTHVFGCPPLLEIIPGIINGLTFSGAYELVFQLIPSVLTLWTVKNTDPSVAVKLLFLAYKRGCSSMLIALYHRSRGTFWAGMATLALAWAARQTEHVQLLSGLVVPDSPEESIVESVLRRCPDTCKSELLLMDFYILMQRYADALKICEQIVSNHSVEAQRVQVIASHLRSLMPNGNESYCLRYTLESEGPVQSTFDGSHPCRTAVPNCCPLQNEEEELVEAVARTTAHICARRHDERSIEALGSSHQREVSVMAFTPTPAASLGITRDKARGALRGGTTGLSARREEQEQQLIRQSESSAPLQRAGRREEATTDARTRTPPLRSIGATAAAAVISLDGEPLYCEAILKRSKKSCGRKRPCEYHDKESEGSAEFVLSFASPAVPHALRPIPMTDHYPEAMYYPTVDLLEVEPDCDVFAFVPYLQELRLSPSRVIYQPPTVGALRAAGVPGELGSGGGSEWELELVGDLPVITLAVECGPRCEAPAPAVHAAGLLRPPEREGVDWVVEELLRGRHPAPDQGYWSEEYWDAILADNTMKESSTNRGGNRGNCSTPTPVPRTSSLRRRRRGNNNGDRMCLSGNCVTSEIPQPRRAAQKRKVTITSGGRVRTDHVLLPRVRPIQASPPNSLTCSSSSQTSPKATRVTCFSRSRIHEGRAARTTSWSNTGVGQQKKQPTRTETYGGSRSPKRHRGAKHVTPLLKSHSVVSSSIQPCFECSLPDIVPVSERASVEMKSLAVSCCSYYSGEPVVETFPPLQADVQVAVKEAAAAACVGSGIAVPMGSFAGTSGAANAIGSNSMHSSFGITTGKGNASQRPTLVSFGQNISVGANTVVVEPIESAGPDNAQHVPYVNCGIENRGSILPVKVSYSDNEATEPTMHLRSDSKFRANCCVLM